MPFVTFQKARDAVRSYPFKKGQSELKKFYARLFPANEPFSIVTVDGLQLFLHNYKENVRVFWWFEEVEPPLQFYIRRFLPVGARVIDVGANTGILGLLAARLKSANVVLVEAYGILVENLEKTLRLNPEISSLCRLITQPCALGPFDDRFGTQPTITIEKIIRDAGWDHVELLKVDIDGPDFDVLSSAGSYLRPDFIDAIYIETESASPKDMIKVAELGYIPYATKRSHLPDLRRLWVNQTERTHFRPLDLATLTAANVPSNTLYLAKTHPLNDHLRRWCA